MIKIVTIKILGIISLKFGICIILWFIYNQITPTPEFQSNYRSIFQLLIPLAFITAGWRWIKYNGAGIENTPPDFDCKELKESIKIVQKTLPAFIQEVEKNVDEAYIKFPLDVSNQGLNIYGPMYIQLEMENSMFPLLMKPIILNQIQPDVVM
jgi:hypothetical protein